MIAEEESGVRIQGSGKEQAAKPQLHFSDPWPLAPDPSSDPVLTDQLGDSHVLLLPPVRDRDLACIHN